MPRLVRRNSSMADAWALFQEDIPDNAIAKMPVLEEVSLSDSDVDGDTHGALPIDDAVSDTGGDNGRREVAGDAGEGAHGEDALAKDEQGQGDTDMEDDMDVDVDEANKAYEVVDPAIANLKDRDIWLYEDYTPPNEGLSTPTPAQRTLPKLTLQQIVYGLHVPRLNLQTWSELLAPRQKIRCRARYRYSQAEFGDGLKGFLKETWGDIFFRRWNLRQIYGETCPSIGYAGEVLSPLPVTIRSVLETAYLADATAIEETTTTWMLWGLHVKHVMIVGRLVALELLRTGTLVSLIVKDESGYCDVYFMVSRAARHEFNREDAEPLAIGNLVQVIGYPSRRGPDHVHPTTIITTLRPKVVSERLSELHKEIADHTNYAFSMFVMLRRVAVINCIYRALFKDVMVTQKEFSTVNDIEFNDDRVCDAIPILETAMRRLQDENPLGELGVGCVLKFALPKLARAKVLAPEVIAAAVGVSIWNGWLGERVNEDRILCWRCVEPLH